MKPTFLTALLLVVLLSQGCGGWFKVQEKSQLPEPTDAKTIVYRTVAKADWLVTAGIVGVAVSVFAALNGSRAAYAAGIACLVAISMTLSTQRYALWIAGGGLLVAAGAAAYTVFVKNRALAEIVGGIQRLPAAVKDIVKEKQEQASATKAIVAKIKNGG